MGPEAGWEGDTFRADIGENKGAGALVDSPRPPPSLLLVTKFYFPLGNHPNSTLSPEAPGLVHHTEVSSLATVQGWHIPTSQPKKSPLLDFLLG